MCELATAFHRMHKLWMDGLLSHPRVNLTFCVASGIMVIRGHTKNGRRSFLAPCYKGGDKMDSAVTWADLIQYTYMLIALVSVLYAIFHKKK